MFHLKPNPSAGETQRRMRDVIAEARQRLDDSAAGLEFEPSEHVYTFHGRKMRSVSSIVEHFATFDAEAAARRVAANPKHELFGRSIEEILAIWKARADEASSAGTEVHSFGEACCAFLTGGEVEPQYLERITSEGLAAASPKEEAVARWWSAFDWSRYAVVAKETRVVNPLLGYAGTFDLLLYEIATGLYPLRDYKTNADLRKWYGSMMKAPLSVLKDNDIGHYTVQQSCYAMQLGNAGLRPGDRRLLWLRADGTPEEVELETNYDRLIAWAIKTIN